MISSAEKPDLGFPGFKIHTGKPWFGITPLSDTIYRSNIPALSRENWSQITQNGQPLGGLSKFQERVIDANRKVLQSTDWVTLVADGRVSIFNQGYLGDLVEATRFINPLLEAGYSVRILTSNSDIFEGVKSNKVEVRGIPSDMPSANKYPWEQRLLRYIGQAAKGSPVIFPVNARLPLALELDPEGNIKNPEKINELNDYLNQSPKQIGIRHEKWAKLGVHQIQALQGFRHLLGFPGALDQANHPSAFLHPDQYSVQVANEVIASYGCFDSTSGKKPLLLHPGVATDGRKVNLKGYPEEKWKEAITEIANSDAPVCSLTMLKPVDQEQGFMADRLVKHAESVGFDVSEVPMADITEKYGWSLGSFIAFLKALSLRKGILLGCDSMPAGHAGPALDLEAVVLGSPFFNPTFFGPTNNSIIVMPPHDLTKYAANEIKTSHIEPRQIAKAVEFISQ